jgi:hypothetical protein
VTVYIDDANIAWGGKRWCHLYADSLPELEAFARKVGLAPDWLQHPTGERGLPHYDVTGSMFTRCVSLGAERVTPGDGNYRRLRQALTRGEYVLAEIEGEA